MIELFKNVSHCMKNSGNIYTAEYCPDNTCDKAQGKSKNILEKYFFLFLFSKSSYIYLDDWKKNPEVIKDAKKIVVELTPKSCSGIKEIVDRGKCLLDKANTQKIKFLSVRTDEGTTIESEAKD